MLCISQFCAGLYALMVKEPLLYEFGSACLYSEVILGESDFGFAGVAILRYKITCIACQHHIIYLPLSAFGKIYHFPDVGKMIRRLFTSVIARFFSSNKHISKTFPFGIA